MYVPKANRDSEGVDAVTLKSLNVCLGEISVLQKFHSQYFLEAKIRGLRQLERLLGAFSRGLCLATRKVVHIRKDLLRKVYTPSVSAEQRRLHWFDLTSTDRPRLLRFR